MTAVTQLGDEVVAFAPRGRAKVQEIVTAIDPEGAQFAANMILWLDTLPTSEPATVGEPWLNSGVLTVGNGP